MARHLHGHAAQCCRLAHSIGHFSQPHKGSTVLIAHPAAHQLELAVAFLALTKQQFGEMSEVVQAILAQVVKTMDEILVAIERSDIGVALLEKGQAIGKAEGEALGEAAMREQLLGRLWRKRYQADLMPAHLAKVATLATERYSFLFDSVADGSFSLKQAIAWLDAE